MHFFKTRFRPRRQPSINYTTGGVGNCTGVVKIQNYTYFCIRVWSTWLCLPWPEAQGWRTCEMPPPPHCWSHPHSCPRIRSHHSAKKWIQKVLRIRTLLRYGPNRIFSPGPPMFPNTLFIINEKLNKSLTLIQIRVRDFTLMRFRIRIRLIWLLVCCGSGFRILLLIKAMQICDHLIPGPPRLSFLLTGPPGSFWTLFALKVRLWCRSLSCFWLWCGSGSGSSFWWLILIRIRLQYGSGSRSATLNTTDFTHRVPVKIQNDKIVNEKRSLVVGAAINKSRRQK